MNLARILRTRPSTTRMSGWPIGWFDKQLSLHRQWHSRRVLNERLRHTLILLVPLGILIAFGTPAILLLLALLGMFIPTRPPTQTLKELDTVTGSAYTTALAASEDRYGLYSRVRNQAKHSVNFVNIPAWPWLEVMMTLALITLVFALRNAILSPAGPDTVASQEGQPFTLTPGAPLSTPEPAATAQRDRDLTMPTPQGAAQTDGRNTASNGSGGTPNLGSTNSSGTAGDPEHLSEQFLETLTQSKAHGPEGSRNAQTNTQTQEKPSRSQEANPTDPSESSRPTETQPPQSEAKDARSNETGNASSPSQNNGQNSRSQTEPRANQYSSEPGRQPNTQQPQGSAQGAQNRAPGQRPTRGGPQDDNTEPFPGSEGEASANPTNRTRGTPGQGGRDAMGEVDPEAISQEGKLEYLPGTILGSETRSSTLQLPGKPGESLSGREGAQTYKRVPESAVLDPRLPPEYRELLERYYR